MVSRVDQRKQHRKERCGALALPSLIAIQPKSTYSVNRVSVVSMSRIAEDGEDILNDELWYDVEVVDVTGCREIYHVPPLHSSPLLQFALLTSIPTSLLLISPALHLSPRHVILKQTEK